MGIYDREYYRREGPSFLGRIADRGRVCKWLIGINVAVFVIQYLSFSGNFVGIPVLGHFTENFELSIPDVEHGQVWRLLTYAFLHDPNNPWHIVFNMLFLWWFGNEVENIYGGKEFLAVYLLAAVLGGIGFILSYYAHLTYGIYGLGASGAVTAVMVLFALHFPKRIILLFFVLPVPAWLLVIISVALDLSGLLWGSNEKTAFSVHLAGAAFAFVYYKSHVRLLSLLPQSGEVA